MKKILGILFFVLIGCVFILYILSGNKNIKDEFYTILESKGYVIDEDREISFDIYSKRENTLIENPLNNEYVLELDNMKIKLLDIHIDTLKIKDDLYLIKLYASMPKFNEIEYKSHKQTLVITNLKYTLSLEYGEISFLNPKDYKLLSLDTLYGSYIHYNEGLLLAGINLKFHFDYEYLINFSIGVGYGILSKSRSDLLLDNLIDIPSMGYSYKPNKIEENYLLSLKSNTYFIPVGYKNIGIVRSSYITLELDLEKYYFDSFSFMTNNLDLDEYRGYERMGEIFYA